MYGMHFSCIEKDLEGYTCSFDNDGLCRVRLQRIFAFYTFFQGDYLLEMFTCLKMCVMLIHEWHCLRCGAL